MIIDANKIGGFYKRFHIPMIVIMAVLCAISLFFISDLRVSFSFDQFFPENDPDMAKYREFIQDFESDENYLIVGIEGTPDIFNTAYFKTLDSITTELSENEKISSVQSLSTIQLPVITFSGPRFQALIDTSTIFSDSLTLKLREDPRLKDRFIYLDGKASLLFLKTQLGLSQPEVETLIDELEQTFSRIGIGPYHMMGRAYFQSELSQYQIKEISRIAIYSALLLLFIMWFIFRRFYAILISLITISVSFLLFLGFMGTTGRELGFLAALYPVLLMIVSTSDIVHIISKYIQETDKVKSPVVALSNTVKEIGIATLLTSVTTAAGFASLYTSKLQSIQDFGINASVGVFIAYFVTIILGGSLLFIVPSDKIKRSKAYNAKWRLAMNKLYLHVKSVHRYISYAFILLIIILAYGISLVSTNSEIGYILPKGEKIKKDFYWFQENISGFRPIEYIITDTKSDNVLNPGVIKTIDQFEKRLEEVPTMTSIQSINSLYKDINWSLNGAHSIPSDTAVLNRYSLFIQPMLQYMPAVMISKDSDRARVSGRISDIGADKVKKEESKIRSWIDSHIDTSRYSIVATGIGYIFDKNAEYVRQNLVTGLLIAIILVSVFLAILFQSFRLFLVALVPNIIPLLLGGAIMGYFGIVLEAGTSIVFAVIFGIAVDDSIHFLSRYKLALRKHSDVERALQDTYRVTGKALIQTTIILFAGFCVLLISHSEPTTVIGLLISMTLVSALICDLYLVPWMIRLFYKKPKD